MNEEVLSCKKVVGIVEKIEAIPNAMRHMGWSVSADLMERWLHSGAWVLPPEWKSKNPPDPRTLSPAHLAEGAIRMSWAMSYGQVKIAMMKLRAKMANRPARDLLRKRLDDVRWGRDGRALIGSQHYPASQLDQTCQSNYEPFGHSLDTMDDLYGSLGAASLKVALIGEATRDPLTGGVSMHVTHAGFYIRDTYDFRDFQYLGTWTKKGVLTKTQVIMNAATDGMIAGWEDEAIGNIFNHDFDTYRCTSGFGGDFVIFSDVYWERVDLRLDLGQ